MRLPRNVFQLLIAIEAVVLAAVILFGAVHMRREAVQTGKSQAKARAEGEQDRQDFIAKKDDRKPGSEDGGSEAEDESGDSLSQEGGTPVFSEEVQSKIASMTLEEKVAQMFLITPEALTHSDAVEVAGENTKGAIDACPVGGLVYGTVNFKNAGQTQQMLNGTQQYSNERIGLPMFLAVEELGGEGYSPLAAANGFDIQKSPAEVADGGQPQEAAQAADAIAGYLAEEGFNMNLMPAAELAGGTDGIHDGRCYGADASAASMMLAESIHASRGKGIRTAVGTFPGKGKDYGSEEAWSGWKDNEALVFQSGVNAGAECIILGNTLCEPLTGEAEILCSMSEKAVSYLRNEMGYQGILMTDSLSDAAVTGSHSPADAAVAAVKSGVNLLYCPANFEEAYQAVVNAANSNEIPLETIEQSVGYILTQKLAQAGAGQ